MQLQCFHPIRLNAEEQLMVETFRRGSFGGFLSSWGHPDDGSFVRRRLSERFNRYARALKRICFVFHWKYFWGWKLLRETSLAKNISKVEVFKECKLRDEIDHYITSLRNLGMFVMKPPFDPQQCTWSAFNFHQNFHPIVYGNLFWEPSTHLHTLTLAYRYDCG